MNFQLTQDLINEIENLIDVKNKLALIKKCEKLLAPDVAEIIEALNFNDAKYLFNVLGDELKADVLIDLEEDLRERLLESFSSKEIVRCY